MRRIIICFLLLVQGYVSFSQTQSISRKSFFEDDQQIEVILTTDIPKLLNNKTNPDFQKAGITLKLPGSDSTINEVILVRQRGKARKITCNMASLMLDFKTPEAPVLSTLKKLKMVGGCSKTEGDEKYALKEYLVYKIYNLFTEMSFKVRLLKVTYIDSKKKHKPYTQCAFVIEDVDDLAKRNKCKEIQNKVFNTERTNRNQMTLVSMFQFMIANTDWSVPNYHNVKLIVPKEDTLAMPFVVPYDFDYSGFVNTRYAVPTDGLGLTDITERQYRGFARRFEEVDSMANIFIQKEEAVLAIINNFSLCEEKTKKQMAKFIEDFYIIIKDEKELKNHFIYNVRTR